MLARKHLRTKSSADQIAEEVRRRPRPDLVRPGQACPGPRQRSLVPLGRTGPLHRGRRPERRLSSCPVFRHAKRRFGRMSTSLSYQSPTTAQKPEEGMIMDLAKARITMVCISCIGIGWLLILQSDAKIDPKSVAGAWLFDESSGKNSHHTPYIVY